MYSSTIDRRLCSLFLDLTPSRNISDLAGIRLAHVHSRGLEVGCRGRDLYLDECSRPARCGGKVSVLWLVDHLSFFF